MPRSIRSTRGSILGRALVRALALAAVASSAGCGGGDKAVGPVDAALVGTYTLVALNGQPLPAVLYPGPTRSTNVVESTLTLRGDRTYVRTEARRAYRADGSAVAGTDHGDTTQGTFRVRGATVTFAAEFGPGIGVLTIATAEASAGRLAYVDEFSGTNASTRNVFTYEKP